MHIILAKNWWSLLLRGIAAILFAGIAVISPGITVGALVLLFGAYALADGVLCIIGAVRAAQAHERWLVLVLEGFAGIATSVLTMIWPIVTLLVLIFLIAAWALVTGILEIVAAVRLKKLIRGEWLLALSGVASVVLAVLLVAMPLTGALALALWMGAYAFVFGVLLIALAFRLRGWIKTSGSDNSARAAEWRQRRAF